MEAGDGIRGEEESSGVGEEYKRKNTNSVASGGGREMCAYQ